MVQWTEKEKKLIGEIFRGLDKRDFGGKVLSRCLIVYPWTQRYFAKFGALNNAAAIRGNDKVQQHGETVMIGLEKAVKSMGSIKEAYTDLSLLHSDTLHVDPDNFRLLADCFTICLAAQLGSGFSAEIQATLQKFLAVVVFALGRQYH